MSEFVTVPKDPWLRTTKPARTNRSDTHEGKRLRAHRARAAYPPKDEPCRRFEQTLRLALALEMFLIGKDALIARTVAPFNCMC